MSLMVNKFDYKKLNQQTSKNGYRVYITPANEKLPSVTTILNKISDKSAIQNWRKRIGKEEADYITSLSSNVGTCIHKNIENYIKGEDRPKGNSLIRKQGRELSDIVIEKCLKNIDEIWGLEVPLYYPGLYAGTTDMVGLYKKDQTIIDFKNTRKPKKEDWIKNYKIQITAYSLAHNEVYGTNIKKGAIFMISREPEYYGQFQEFIFDIEEWIEPWLQIVEKYYAI